MMKILVGKVIQMHYVRRYHLEFMLSNILKSMVSVYNPSLASYCCEVWNVLGETHRKKLHNRAACIIAHMPNEVDQQTVPSVIG